MILIVQDDKKRNDVFEYDGYQSECCQKLRKITRNSSNDQNERYIKDEMNNSEMTFVKKSGRRRKSYLKDCYKRLRANKKF